MQLTCICIIYEGEKKNPQFATKTTKQLTKRNIHSSTDPSSCLSTHVLFFYIYFKYSPIKKKWSYFTDSYFGKFTSRYQSQKSWKIMKHHEKLVIKIMTLELTQGKRILMNYVWYNRNKFLGLSWQLFQSYAEEAWEDRIVNVIVLTPIKRILHPIIKLVFPNMVRIFVSKVD